jgi:hypothetical protein
MSPGALRFFYGVTPGQAEALERIVGAEARQASARIEPIQLLTRIANIDISIATALSTRHTGRQRSDHVVVVIRGNEPTPSSEYAAMILS